MKTFFSLLLLLLFINSCASDRIRYVRIKGQKQEIIDINNVNNNKADKNEELAHLKVDSKPDQIRELSDVEDTRVPDEHVLQETAQRSDVNDLPELKQEEYPVNEKLNAALWAEDQAFKSRRNMRLSMIFLSLSIIPLVGLILFFIPALILFIIGWTQYATANRSRYITLKGDALLQGAKKGFYFWGVYILLLFLAAALTIGLYYYW